MNKLMIRHTMDKPLPYDAEVEWLESTGTQYIALGLTMLGTDIVTVRCKNTNATLEYNPIFGREKASDNKYWVQYYNNTGTLYFMYYNTYLTAVWTRIVSSGGERYIWDTNWNTFRFYGVYCDINGIRYQQDNTNHRTDSPDLDNPYLFARKAATVLYGSIRISSFKIERNGVVILDFMPVRKNNVGYMYDKVSGQLFGNQGTGQFIIGPDYNPFAYQYLTFVPLEDSTFSFSKRGTGNDIEYSIDGGAWTALASGANTPTVGAGHNIRWRAELVPGTASGSQGIGTFSASGLYDAIGNTMSLLYGDNYIGQTTLVGTYTFCNLWREDAHIYRVDRMVLPATKLTSNCYRGMFQSCTSLTVAPELPANRLNQRCYYQMFYGCTSLATVSELPTTTLVNGCYDSMFINCRSLSYIKCLAIGISATNCTSNWLSGVASTGTFVKAAGMEDWTIGASGIPSGWTVVDDPSTITT